MEKSVKIHRIIKETDDAITVEFENDSLFMDYEPGQFLNLFYDVKGETVSRSYSFSSSPSIDPRPSITLKRVVGGKLTEAILNEYPFKDELRIGPPMGRFSLKPYAEGDHLLFIAGGSGITPLFSMIKTVLYRDQATKVTLLYANRNHSAIIFNHQLQDLELRFQNRFRVLHYLEDSGSDASITTHKGKIDFKALETIVNQNINPAGFYLCGPEKMMESVASHLNEIGVDSSSIHFESYTMKSLPILQEQSPEEVGVSHVIIRNSGNSLSLEMPKSQFILQTALDKGVRLPHSCKEAMCGTCKIKLLSGKVDMIENYALTDTQLAEGFVLLCSSKPLSDEVVLEYPIL